MKTNKKTNGKDHKRNSFLTTEKLIRACEKKQLNASLSFQLVHNFTNRNVRQRTVSVIDQEFEGLN